MKKKKLNKELDKEWRRGKSREEVKELAERLEAEEAERRKLIEMILAGFDESLEGLYKEVKFREDERLDTVEETECFEELKKQIEGLSLDALRRVVSLRDKYGFQYIRDFIWQWMGYEEEEEEEEE